MNRKQRRAAGKQMLPPPTAPAEAAATILAVAMRAHQAGRLDAAAAGYRQVIAIDPRAAAAHFNLGYILQGRGALDDAIACYRQAVALNAGFVEAHTNLGNALQMQGRLNDAANCFREVVTLRPDAAEAHYNLGSALQELGAFGESAASYSRAIALKPDLAAAAYNLGGALEAQGWLNDAFNAYARAAEIEPRRGAFYRALTNAGRIVPGSALFRRMAAMEADMAALPEADRMELHFALGAVYDDQGQRERAFGHWREGNRLKRGRIAYDEAAALALFNRVPRVFTKDLLVAAGSGGAVAPDLPVFVVGMPRSGTTLIEQILASHKQVFGAGELPDLHWLTSRWEAQGKGDHFPEMITALSTEQRQSLGAAYRDRLRARAPNALRVVDKLPGNFLRLGLIQAILPGARIIHVRRDPVDTCLSCFSKLFMSDLPYVYDLAELGRYYRAYERLMEHWRSALPPGILLEVRYEDVVADLEGQARRLIAHCGLAWEESCLAFHQNPRPVQTASAAQIRQPLYGSAVGRWHVYRDLARPLRDALMV